MNGAASMERVLSFGLHELGVAKHTIDTRADCKHEILGAGLWRCIELAIGSFHGEIGTYLRRGTYSSCVGLYSFSFS
jgi:hypothetical protein